MKSISPARIACYGLAPLLPCIIVLASFWLIGIYPFGEETVSIWDLQISYTYFFDWFKHCLQGDGNIFYSFGKSLGGSMFATFTGMCLSPVAWLSVLFPGDNPIDYVTFSIVLKFALAGFTSFLYLDHRFELPYVFSLCLSVCYSMMLFMTTQSANPMWMEVVVLLPLVMYGIYRLVHQGKCVLLFIALLACIVINYYNGYMVCLFTMMFYTFESYLAAPTSSHVRGRLFVFLGRFCATFTLAVAASIVVLLPTVLGLMGGKGAVPAGLFGFEFRYELIDVFRSFFLGVYEKELLPQLYTGTLVLICAVWFFINKRIDKRERIAAGIVLGILIVSTWFAPLDRIWLGLRDGNSFYCRYTFLISAMLVFCAARCLSTAACDNWKGLVYAAAAVLVAAVVIVCDGNFPRIRYFLATAVGCILLPLGIVFWTKWEEKALPYRGVLAVCLILFVSLEAFVSCHEVFQYRLYSDNRSSYSRYEQYFSEGYDQFAELDAQDGTEVNDYRVDKTYGFLSPYRRIASNEGLVYGYSHVEQYDSAYDDRVQNFLCAMGYAPDNSCRTAYNDPILLADSILGISYVASDECPIGFVESGLDETQDGNRFYVNPYSLPLGYGADAAVLNDIESTINPFEYEDALMDALIGEDSQYYQRLEVTQVVNEQGLYSWEVTVPANAFAYGYITAPYYINEGMEGYRLDLYENDKLLYEYLDNWSYGIFPLMDSDQSSTRTIRLEGEAPDGFSVDDLYVYILNMDAFSKAIEQMRAHPLVLDAFEDGYIHGTYATETDSVLFTTIPYDAGWTVVVNGKEVEPKIAQKTFIAIEVSAGENAIEMRYMPAAVVPGIVIFGISVLLFVVFIVIVEKRDRRKQKQNSTREDWF